MDQKLYLVECDPMCAFKVQSHDKDEVKRMAMDHVTQIHHQKTSDSEIESQLKII